MGGNRNTKATKGGKYMNPTDQARKEERKKQLKKHKKQREQVREAVIKSKNPNTVLDELSKLDDLEFDTENECPYADRVMQEKRQRMRSTYFKILEYYKNAGKMDTWKEHQDDFNTYEKERERKKSLHQAVLKAKNWSVDQIPLPDAPMPDSGFAISAPIGLPPKQDPRIKALGPPGPPPGPPPDKKVFKRKPHLEKGPSVPSIQNTLLALAGQEAAAAAKTDEEDNPPPPPPGAPPVENRARNPYQAQFHPRPPQPIQTPQQPVPAMAQSLPPYGHHQQQYQQQKYPAGSDIAAAPTSYNAPRGVTDSSQKLSATHQKTLSAAPVITRPKGGPTTMFMPTALRGAKNPTTKPPPRAMVARPISTAPKVSQPVEQDKAYEKFMAEMSGLM